MNFTVIMVFVILSAFTTIRMINDNHNGTIANIFDIIIILTVITVIL